MISLLKRPTIDIIDLGIQTNENKITSKTSKIAQVACSKVQRFVKEKQLETVRDIITEELYNNVWRSRVFGLTLRVHYIYDGCFASKSAQQYFADSICASILKYRYDLDGWMLNNDTDSVDDFCFDLITKGIDNLYCQSLNSEINEFTKVKYIQPDEINTFIFEKSE